MKNLLSKLWNDDCGAIVTAEYLTLGSVVVLGGVGGLSMMRDSVNSEMQEFGNSVRSIRQSYSSPGFSGGGASTAGSAHGAASSAPTASPAADCHFVP